MTERPEKQPAVYIMAKLYRGTMYVGVTSNYSTGLKLASQSR